MSKEIFVKWNFFIIGAFSSEVDPASLVNARTM